MRKLFLSILLSILASCSNNLNNNYLSNDFSSNKLEEEINLNIKENHNTNDLVDLVNNPELFGKMNIKDLESINPEKLEKTLDSYFLIQPITIKNNSVLEEIVFSPENNYKNSMFHTKIIKIDSKPFIFYSKNADLRMNNFDGKNIVKNTEHENFVLNADGSVEISIYNSVQFIIVDGLEDLKITFHILKKDLKGIIVTKNTRNNIKIEYRD